MRRPVALLCAILLTSAARAETPDVARRLAVELNAARTDQGSCALTFVVTNGLPDPIEELVFETVLFTTEGQVDRLTLFSFGALPTERQRVRQFSVPNLPCETLGQVLFNGAQTCNGPGLTIQQCETSLLATSRTGIRVSN